MGARREDIYERAKAITAEWADERLLPELSNADGSRDSDVIVDQRGLVMRLAGEFEVNRATAAGAVIRVIKERRAARSERIAAFISANACPVEIYVADKCEAEPA